MPHRKNPAQPYRVFHVGLCRFKELAYETGKTVYQIKYGQFAYSDDGEQ